MVKTALVDTVGVTLAGAMTEPVDILCRTLIDDDTQGRFRILGRRDRTSILDATMINGTASHALDFDDMAVASGGHPSVTLLPVLFAMAEQKRISGLQLIDAFIVGFEAECRLGLALHPHHYERGWHPTSTLGIFGAGVAAARLMQLDERQTSMVIALCASMASGIKANFGTMTKPFHAGHCARGGLLAAKLVSNGFTANPAALDHKQGFFAVYDGLENIDVSAVLFRPDGPLLIDQEPIYLKQFPCCGSTHRAIAGMLHLREQKDINTAAIAGIIIRAHHRRLPHTDNGDPRSSLAAKFSIQYAAIRALLDGPPTLRHFEGDAFTDAEVQRLLRLTRVEALPGNSRSIAEEWAAEVEVILSDGQVLSVQLDGVLGRGPTNPMSDGEMWAKFSDCATRALTDGETERAFDALNRIDDEEDVTSVINLLVPSSKSAAEHD
jgi:2-methylcitrate dehydratase PrpD